MKVVDLGHGGFAIEPTSPADAVQTLTRAQLERSNVSSEAIDIFRGYVEQTSAVNKSDSSQGK
ncbi:hypothetical protein CI1B_00490 [Bradyrhizobium ivorense]|uniref:Uncharacterized protein n=1 Tax=Bradyrhizobium ivorense TaxID=2511166 RepID=A0A508SQU3_9BRAD|nr:hypothetical protein [Bradyrhizobium ivorense]VIO64955.1 hypothetical protein CI1B_00490 [Bradyrhizobium ivorense]VIO79245.1 hypothetical protein CI41S_68130 [Bradyrhizobium ivorense]